MSLQETYRVEKKKWNKVAEDKMGKLGQQVLKPGEDFYDFCRKSATHIGVAEFLGDLTNKHVLEYGCGLGQMSSLLAKDDAKLTSFDLSINSVRFTRQRAKLNKVDQKIELAVSAGERLPFASESFDVIFGKAILHHLDVREGQADLLRMLKPGGRAVFVEPMGMNPFLNFAREHLPYPGKNARGADSPLVYDEIRAWGQGFREFRFQEVQLLGMLERYLGHKRLPGLRKLDRFLLKNVPFLRRYCRYVVMYMVK